MRRETGAEDDTRVAQVRVGDDSLPHARDRLVQPRKHHAVDERVEVRNAWAAGIASGEVWRASNISTSIICATGLKKCSPTRRSGRSRIVERSCSGMLDVLVARMAPSFMRGSIDA